MTYRDPPLHHILFASTSQAGEGAVGRRLELLVGGERSTRWASAEVTEFEEVSLLHRVLLHESKTHLWARALPRKGLPSDLRVLSEGGTTAACKMCACAS